MYRVMIIQPNGIPAPVDNKLYVNKEQAEEHMKEMEHIYGNKLFVGKF